MTEYEAAKARVSEFASGAPWTDVWGTGPFWFRALRADLNLIAEHEGRAEPCRECDAVSGAIGGVEFMDPPDGGSVTLSEQVRRMRAKLDAIPPPAITPRLYLVGQALAGLAASHGAGTSFDLPHHAVRYADATFKEMGE